jgi:dihydroflavonol-4-reductase
MRIFLTGASGYIGLALCRRLAGDGHELRALVRATSATAELERLGVTLFEGDVTDRYSMREGMSGADWVIHAAAELDFEAPEQRMRRINVDGSENVASLAWKLGVGRLLAISSIAAWGGSPPDGSPSDESSPPSLPLPSSYSVTKRAADDAIASWAERGLAVNTVYPSLVYGPPGKKQGFNALLRRVLKGRMPAIIGADRKLTLVHVDDLVDGISRIMERAERGERYLLAGDAVELGALVREAARLGAVSAPRLELSIGTAAFLMLLAKPLYALRGHRPPLSPPQLASLKRHWRFDDSKARRELGWSPRPLAEGLPPTIEYLAST